MIVTTNRIVVGIVLLAAANLLWGGQGSVSKALPMPTSRPAALTTAQKLSRANSLRKPGSPLYSQVDSDILLSVAKGSVPGRGHLRIGQGIRYIDYKAEVVSLFPASGPPATKAACYAEYTVPEAGQYLIDFNVSMGGSTKTMQGRVKTLTGSPEQFTASALVGPQSPHFTFVYQASGPKRISIEAWVDVNWSFYSVEISKLS
jgi:hypothetical protein